MSGGRAFDAAKRALDVAVAGPALLVPCPVMLIVAAVVRVGLGSPVLFVQPRPGRHGVPFDLLKFRTMTDAVGPDGEPLPDAVRLNRTGRLLRSTSLDEIPSLVNVLRGDMSLVGPRPLLVRYLELYSAEQRRRHDVRPGVTGWAQVNGRNALDWETRFRLDVWYVDNRSLRLDLRILAMTVVRALRRDGISAAGQATVTYFEAPRGRAVRNGSTSRSTRSSGRAAPDRSPRARVDSFPGRATARLAPVEWQKTRF